MRWIALLVFVGGLGCSQQTVHGTHLSMRMVAPQQAVLLIVNGVDRISYGGGHDALQDSTTWHGQITSHQRIQFDAIIASSDWLEVDTQYSNQTQGYEIRIRQGTIDNTFFLPFSDQTAIAMYDLLQSIALTRLEPTLDALPKPSMDTIIDRKVSGMSDQ